MMGARNVPGRFSLTAIQAAKVSVDEETAAQRLTTEVHWSGARDARRARSATQANWDDASGTRAMEKGSALDAIWFDGATLYSKGPGCGRVMECFTGAYFGFGTITRVHTVVSKLAALDDKIQRHEYVHVRQYESLGGVGFDVAYATGYTLGISKGLSDPGQWWASYADTEGCAGLKLNQYPYMQNFMEVDAYSGQNFPFPGELGGGGW